MAVANRGPERGRRRGSGQWLPGQHFRLGAWDARGVGLFLPHPSARAWAEGPGREPRRPLAPFQVASRTSSKAPSGVSSPYRPTSHPRRVRRSGPGRVASPARPQALGISFPHCPGPGGAEPRSSATSGFPPQSGVVVGYHGEAGSQMHPGR